MIGLIHDILDYHIPQGAGIHHRVRGEIKNKKGLFFARGRYDDIRPVQAARKGAQKVGDGGVSENSLVIRDRGSGIVGRQVF